MQTIDGGLEVAQIELDVPAPRIKLREIVLADLAMVKQRGDQYLASYFDCTHREFVGKARVLLKLNPLWAGRRFWPTYDVVMRAHRLPTAKVSEATYLRRKLDRRCS